MNFGNAMITNRWLTLTIDQSKGRNTKRIEKGSNLILPPTTTGMHLSSKIATCGKTSPC